MLAKADVFIQNLAPGAAGRLGLGHAGLRDEHPRLLTCDISGYGETGPYAQMQAYDLLVQAESGLASVTGRPEGPGRDGVPGRPEERRVGKEWGGTGRPRGETS